MPQRPDLELVSTNVLANELIRRHDAIVIIGVRFGDHESEHRCDMVIRMGSNQDDRFKLHADEARVILETALNAIKAVGGNAD